MLDLILLYGLIYAAIFTAAILSFAFVGPRIMLHSYPPEIQKVVPPKTLQEKRKTVYAAVPFITIFMGYPLVAALMLSNQLHWNTLNAFIFIYGLMFFINVYDLLVLDWFMFCYITPRFVVLPGTEGNIGYKNYQFHFIGFLKGVIITLVLSLSLTAIIYLINHF